ncbi:hypothetical protein GNE00_09255 [Pseudomonas sp. JL972]|uniref:hypothetical protein n=1 Tax=Stutzerimonas degradans TaxID=2968968 RepID=UPI0012D89DB3|nr:hypothetical protein [Stutzerimonas degradans]MTZ13924.1 hypothetical protein [Stutzerimonas degradans]
MSSQRLALDVQTALTYVGQTVLVELRWDEEPESFWQCMHILGVVLPMEGVCDLAYFMGLNVSSQLDHPNEVYFSDICTIRVMRHRDRRGSGNVLDRVALPNAERSGAALPARRDSLTVPSNGSTGAAHP